MSKVGQHFKLVLIIFKIGKIFKSDQNRAQNTISSICGTCQSILMIRRYFLIKYDNNKVLTHWIRKTVTSKKGRSHYVCTAIYNKTYLFFKHIGLVVLVCIISNAHQEAAEQHGYKSMEQHNFKSNMPMVN
jgi:hypothetical protein